jgi:hypothetical protein
MLLDQRRSNMQTATKERILETLEQHTRPVDLEALSSKTNTSVEQLKGYMGELATIGAVQRIGRNHYRYAGAPLPKEGESFKGEVTGTSFKGGVILRDENGTSWRIEPV